MSGISTATVETLTAEVRVLMVGSRQVTLSVARQLDEVELNAMAPFGRVSIDKRGNLVVGAHLDTGALVLAEYLSPYQLGIPYLPAAGLPHPIYVCRNWANRTRPGGIILSFEGTSIEVGPDGVKWCYPGDHGDDEHTHWNADGLEDLIRSEIADHEEYASRHRAAALLPLIVLAGLR